MKKGLGILRNRIDRLAAVKKEAQRKKNRFQIVGKDDLEDNYSIAISSQPAPSQLPTRIPLA